MRKLFRRPPLQPRRSPTENPGLGLRSGLSVQDLFVALDERKTRYLVLRWFAGLPLGEPDGDIDLLVHDDDLDLLADLLEHDPQAIQCDVFSVGGRPGTTYYGMPYLPPDKATTMLVRAKRFADTCAVPNAEDHFLSLAYHALYHKGLRSGLPTSKTVLIPRAAPNHDYAGTLSALAKDGGIDVQITLESLDSYLEERGWRPSPAVLSRLAPHNPWLAAHFVDTAL